MSDPRSVEAKLIKLKELADLGKLPKWETGFITDNYEKMEDRGVDALSSRVQDIIHEKYDEFC